MPAYLANYQHDIFVSSAYNHDTQNWENDLLERLNSKLAFKLNHYDLYQSQADRPDLSEQLTQSAILLSP